MRPSSSWYNSNVGRLDSLLFAFNSLTGRSRRYNRALRDITGWSSTIQELLIEYDLYEESFNLDTMLGNIGKLRFELIRITYRAHAIIKIARNIKGVKPLVYEIINELEDLGRTLLNPAFNHTKLIKTIPELRNSVLKLRAVISEIEDKELSINRH